MRIALRKEEQGEGERKHTIHKPQPSLFPSPLFLPSLLLLGCAEQELAENDNDGTDTDGHAASDDTHEELVTLSLGEEGGGYGMNREKVKVKEK